MKENTNQLVKLAQHFEAQGDLESAQIYYRLHWRSHASDPKANLWLGNAYRKLKKYRLASKYYKKAITLKPNYTPAINNLIFVLKQMLEFEELKIYQKMLPAGDETPFLSIASSDNPKVNLQAAKRMVKNDE